MLVDQVAGSHVAFRSHQACSTAQPYQGADAWASSHCSASWGTVAAAELYAGGQPCAGCGQGPWGAGCMTHQCRTQVQPQHPDEPGSPS